MCEFHYLHVSVSAEGLNGSPADTETPSVLSVIAQRKAFHLNHSSTWATTPTVFLLSMPFSYTRKKIFTHVEDGFHTHTP